MPLRNRIYPPPIIDEIYRDIKAGGIYAVMEYGHMLTVNMDRVIGKVSTPMMSEDGGISVLLEVMESPMGIITKALLDTDAPLTLLTSGTGRLTDNGTVYNFKLRYCYLKKCPIMETDTCPFPKLI